MLNFGDMFEAIEAAIAPDTPAHLHGDTIVTWGEAARLSNNLARGLLALGLEPGDKVAMYMRNRPDYLIATIAAFKARLVHVNVNYRYERRELAYLLDNSDARAVIYGAEFRERVDAIRGDLPGVVAWIEVDGEDGADSFAQLAEAGDGTPLALARSPDDLLFIYTGGTTGLPKGVMWPHGDLREALVAYARAGGTVPDTIADLAAHVRRAGPGPRVLIVPPLMHGTGLMSALGALCWGGSVVTVPGARFDADVLLAAIDRHTPSSMVIVGDSFGRPLLDALDAALGRYDLGSLQGITSSGVMWSAEVKRGLLRHMPRVALADVLSSSEAVGVGTSITTANSAIETARFALGGRCRVIDEDGRSVAPGSGQPGRLALGPPNPLGYYKDPAKSAATFPVIDGARFSIPGDWCLVEADGSLTFLGRGSSCINTGGEKVFPEEVEEMLKTHESVRDVLVLGVPDPKWGQAIVAVVTADPSAFDEAALRAHVRAALADYKTPKRIVLADRPLRTVSGKADYDAARACALA